MIYFKEKLQWRSGTTVKSIKTRCFSNVNFFTVYIFHIIIINNVIFIISNNISMIIIIVDN